MVLQRVDDPFTGGWHTESKLWTMTFLPPFLSEALLLGLVLGGGEILLLVLLIGGRDAASLLARGMRLVECAQQLIRDTTTVPALVWILCCWNVAHALAAAHVACSFALCDVLHLLLLLEALLLVLVLRGGEALLLVLLLGCGDTTALFARGMRLIKRAQYIIRDISTIPELVWVLCCWK